MTIQKNQIQIRSATLSDATDLHELHTKAVTTVCKDFYTKEQIKGWLTGRSPEGYHRGIINEEIHVACINNKVVGFVHAVPGEIRAVYVHPDFHQKGIGKLILEHGIKIAHNGQSIVTVESTLNAENFYKKHGFKKIKEDKTIRNNVELPIIIMEYTS